MLITASHAIAAADTAFFSVHQLPLNPVALRILTPDAAHGTSLKKDQGPDAGSVVDAKTLNICKNAVFAGFKPEKLFVIRGILRVQMSGEVLLTPFHASSS